MKRVLLIPGVFIIATLAFLFVGQGKVEASSWCNVIGNPSNGKTNNSDCTSGQYNAVFMNMDPSMNSDTLRQKFIDDMNSIDTKYPVNNTGKQYIINMLGGSNWVDNISQSNVTFAVRNIERAYSDKGTAYDPVSNSVVSDSYDTATDAALHIYQNGSIVAIIRLECGNPFGSFSSITPKPQPQPQNPPLLQGYKIDTSASPAGPFSDDRVNALISPGYTYVHGNTDNPFYFKDTTQLSAGTYKVSVTDKGTPDGAWQYIGYQICEAGASSCSLDGKTNVKSPSTTFTMVNNKTYNMRVIYKMSTCPAGMAGTPPNCTDVSSICPVQPTINLSVLFKLPDTMPNSTSGPPSYSKTYGSTYKQDTPSNKTIVTGITDTSTGGDRVALSLTSDRIGQPTATHGQTNVNYKPFVDSYPYDKNSASVTYDTVYTETTWTANKKAYLCNDGSLTSGTNQCSSSYDPCGSATRSHSGNCYYANDTSQANCKSPYTWYSTIGCAQRVSASCNPGDKAVFTSSSNTCIHYSTGDTVYTYTNTSTSGEKKYSNTTDSIAIGACRYRNFNVDSVTPSADLSPDYENPTTGTASATASITFSLDPGVPGGLRTDYSVNDINYTAIFTSGCAGSFSGSFDATAPKSTGQANPVVGSGSCGLSPPVPLGTQVCVDFSVSPAFGKVDEDGNIKDPNGGVKTGDDCSQLVQNEPYLKVFGGDVLAGAGFTSGATCVTPGSSQILGWNKNDGGGYTHGSGTEFAAYAISHIKQFATAQGGGVTAAGPPSGLAFANNPRSGGDYGGNLAGAGCIPDYFSSRAGNNLPNLEVSALSDRTYSAPGNVGTSGANGLRGTVPSGRQLTIYVDGDVYISGDITYGPANQVTDMPSFTLVANGNIYISGNVTRLDGNYIAQNHKIYDCAQANGVPYAQSDVYSNCQNKLTVNGTFVSARTLFLRTGANGSLRFSGSDTGPGNNNASEEFNYTPALWMAPPANNSQPPAYDSITSLPPIL